MQQIMLCGRGWSACTILQLQASQMSKDVRAPLIGLYLIICQSTCKLCGCNDHAGLSWVGYFTQLRFWMAAAKQASDSAGVEPLQLYLTVDQSHGPCAGVCTRLLLHVEHRAWLGARAPCAMRMLLHGGPMTFTTAWLHDRLSDQSRIDDATTTLKFLEHVSLILQPDLLTYEALARRPS